MIIINIKYTVLSYEAITDFIVAIKIRTTLVIYNPIQLYILTAQITRKDIEELYIN